MRKVLIVVLASIAVLCGAGVIAAFALAPKPIRTATHQIPTVRPTVTAPPATATPAAPGTPYTTDATLDNIPTWMTPTEKLIRAHSIHVWLETAACMRKLGYRDFHYRVFWDPSKVTRDSENFWTDGMSSAKATKALTDEFGPSHITVSSTGCHGRANLALQQQLQNGN